MNLTFDRFVFDSERRALLEGSQPVHLSPKAFRLLEVLVSHSPRALSKDELQEQVWPRTFVEESNLAGLVKELRSALRDDVRNPRFIRTVRAFGYAFCCELSGGPRPKESTRSAIVVFQGDELSLYEGANVLGRDATADVQVDDVTVSRRHACITVRSDSASIEDLDSKNGTFLEGARLAGTAPLLEGQTIVLGDARLIFKRGALSGSTVTLHGTARND